MARLVAGIGAVGSFLLAFILIVAASIAGAILSNRTCTAAGCLPIPDAIAQALLLGTVWTAEITGLLIGGGVAALALAVLCVITALELFSYALRQEPTRAVMLGALLAAVLTVAAAGSTTLFTTLLTIWRDNAPTSPAVIFWEPTFSAAVDSFSTGALIVVVSAIGGAGLLWLLAPPGPLKPIPLHAADTPNTCSRCGLSAAQSEAVRCMLCSQYFNLKENGSVLEAATRRQPSQPGATLPVWTLEIKPRYGDPVRNVQIVVICADVLEPQPPPVPGWTITVSERRGERHCVLTHAGLLSDVQRAATLTIPIRVTAAAAQQRKQQMPYSLRYTAKSDTESSPLKQQYSLLVQRPANWRERQIAALTHWLHQHAQRVRGAAAGWLTQRWPGLKPRSSQEPS